MGRRRKPAHTHGVLVIDKPAAMTSHDVVSRVRRLFQQRRVGHAGTLDPAATGVLVVMLGEATKLAPYLTGHDKAYRATIQFGRSTDTLDMDGTVTAEAPLPPWWQDVALARQRVEAALVGERARELQHPPVYSAIKVDGQVSHRLARRGQALQLPARAVAVREITLETVHPEGRATVTLTVQKGYYVRSLARDVGRRLRLPAHVCALQRTASGPFTLAQAAPLNDALLGRLLPLSAAAKKALPFAKLTESGRAKARQGQLMTAEDFEGEAPAALAAWLCGDDELVAVGEPLETGFRVVRGFVGGENLNR